MANINSVVLVGRMTKEAEVKQTEKSAIANFTIAVNYFDSRTKEEVPSFFDIKCFAHNANYIGKYGAKGAKVTIAGEARQERWEHEGQKRSKVVFYANNIELDGKKDTEGSGNVPLSSKGFPVSVTYPCEPSYFGAVFPELSAPFLPSSSMLLA